MALTATVLGASGYSGGEVLRLLAGHPAIEVVAAGARSRAGEAIATIQPHLGGLDLELTTLEVGAATDADVCFSCLPSGALPGLVSEPVARLVVDLADDNRSIGGGNWVYGLTEFARPEVRSATHVANPGCYPTAALLALVPFARVGAAAAPIVIDALSGTSGAGRRAEDRLLFAGLDGSAGAYGTTSHRHTPEIEGGLLAFGGVEASVSFTPHLVPMARGLLVTARARMPGPLSDEDALAILSQAYADEPFVEVIPGWPTTKAVSGSNRAQVSARVDERSGWLITSCAIDNLGKGAAGQAIQNANLMLGLDETAGLTHKGVWP